MPCLTEVSPEMRTSPKLPKAIARRSNQSADIPRRTYRLVLTCTTSEVPAGAVEQMVKMESTHGIEDHVHEDVDANFESERPWPFPPVNPRQVGFLLLSLGG